MRYVQLPSGGFPPPLSARAGSSSGPLSMRSSSWLASPATAPPSSSSRSVRAPRAHVSRRRAARSVPALVSRHAAAGIKLLLFPLTKQQIESTQKMQAIGPAAKALQEKYRDRDPARLNVELQKLYQDNEVNPLAGCLPAFAQIPLFIGLYRSLLLLAKEDKLEQPFLWLPSLEGPVADYQQGIGWLTEWVNGAPKFGWADTAAYLVLPVLLVLSQYASMELLTPKSDDPAQAQSQAILKFLPLMIGWFSLNVPSGLGARLALARARTRPPTYAAPAAPTPRSPTARAAQASTGSPTTSSPPPRLSPSARWRQRWRSRWRAAAAARRRRWSRPRPRALAAGALAR